MNWFERTASATGLVYDVSRWAIVLAIGLSIMEIFIVGLTRIDGLSMEPTLKNNEWTMVDKLAYRLDSPRRNEIVNLRFPGDPLAHKYVKRIVGVPGDELEIKNEKLIINNVEYIAPGPLGATGGYGKTNRLWKLAADSFFVIGDNPINSSDSRSFGPVEARFIIGQVRYVAWPPSDFRVLE